LDKNIFIQLVKEFGQKPTKRDQASTIARIYDVLGLISHFTIRGKILLQRSSANKVDWDKTIDEKAAQDWKTWLSQLGQITNLKFPRRFAQLNVFIDEQGIMRIKSRANVNNECFPEQFAPLLPRKSVLVTALLAHFHIKHEHVHVDSQVAEIRSKVWIPQLRMALKTIGAHCNHCRIKKAIPYSPAMAPLPTDRVNSDLKPFEIVGIDVLGPLKPTINGNHKKNIY